MATSARHLRQLAESCGLRVEHVDMRHSHPRVHVVAPDGRRQFFVFPRSTSDHRAQHNQRARLRAFARNARAG